MMNVLHKNSKSAKLKILYFLIIKTLNLLFQQLFIFGNCDSD